MGQFLPVLCTAATAEGTMAGLLKIYGQSDSGNCHKVKFTADRLGIPNEWIETNNMVGEARTPEFLAINAFAEVPAVVLPDGRPLWQSNAIVQYLAEGSELLPDDAYSRAQVSAWQFWEQYSHEPYIAVCRASFSSAASRPPLWSPGGSSAAIGRSNSWRRISRSVIGSWASV